MIQSMRCLHISGRSCTQRNASTSGTICHGNFGTHMMCQHWENMCVIWAGYLTLKPEGGREGQETEGTNGIAASNVTGPASTAYRTHNVPMVALIV